MRPLAGMPVAACQVAPVSVEYQAVPAYPPATALLPSVGSNATSMMTTLGRTLVHAVWPAFVVFQTPVDVAARSVVAAVGWTARRFVYHQLELAVVATWSHVSPASVETNTPAPRLPTSPLPATLNDTYSPVPA